MPIVIIPGRWYGYVKYAAPQPRAIVLGFHGAPGDGPTFADQSKLHLRGAPAVFAYPSGQWGTWDSRPGSPDVTMAGALIAQLWRAHGLLPVYATGISAGASMAYRVACECEVEKLAAVAAGLNPVEAAHAPASDLHIHGDADPLVPFAGGGLLAVPPMQAGLDLLTGMGCAITVRMVEGGGHVWALPGFDTTGEILRAWGLLPAAEAA